MISYEKVVAGIAAFVEEEIVPKLAGTWKAWAVGAAVSVALSKPEELMCRIRDNPTISMLGLVDGDMLDIDTIYRELRAQAEKRNATVDVPFIGEMTFSVRDVERLYQLIMR